MDRIVPPDLQRAGLLGKFNDPVEAAYQKWSLKRNWPAMRVICWISVGFWIVSPLFAPPLLEADEPLPVKFYVVCWGVSAPTLLLFAILGVRLLRPWTAPVVLIFLTFNALLIFSWSDAPSTHIVLVATALLFMYLAPVMQFSFRATGVVVFVTILMAGVWAISAADQDGSWPIGLKFLLWTLSASAILALGASVVVENSSRDRFVDEHVISRQQEKLVSSHALIRRYAPPAVVDRIEDGDTTVDSAQRRRVTIFFADVVGFTVLADRLDPEALAEIVNEYLGSVSQLVEKHGGTLNEFAGDGVMAIFGAPNEMEPRDQVLAALEAANELQGSLPEWSQRWYPLGISQDLQARIGINSGVVSVGTFGSAVRATYTGIGLQTNIAARIQAQCSPGSVLLSNTSWHLISDAVQCEPHGEVEVKGVHFPIAMYEPRAE